jgi:hypothetical protein
MQYIINAFKNASFYKIFIIFLLNQLIISGFTGDFCFLILLYQSWMYVTRSIYEIIINSETVFTIINNPTQ